MHDWQNLAIVLLSVGAICTALASVLRSRDDRYWREESARLRRDRRRHVEQ